MGESASSREQIVFREYQKRDKEKCVEMTSNAWPDLLGTGLDLTTFEWYQGSATWKEVACISDCVVGLLFGKINSELTILGRLRILFSHIAVYLKAISGLYGRIPHRLKFIKKGMLDDRNEMTHSPKVDGEVCFFVVNIPHHGKGIGKQLMDRFIDHAKKAGAKKISAHTTNPGSSWEFYERYGFKKYSNFREEFSSFSRGDDVTAIIYVLDIQ